MYVSVCAGARKHAHVCLSRGKCTKAESGGKREGRGEVEKGGGEGGVVETSERSIDMN